MSNELVTIFPRRALKCIEKGDVKKADEILDQILSNLKELSQEAPSLYWPELARIMYVWAKLSEACNVPASEVVRRYERAVAEFELLHSAVPEKYSKSLAVTLLALGNLYGLIDLNNIRCRPLVARAMSLLGRSPGDAMFFVLPEAKDVLEKGSLDKCID